MTVKWLRIANRNLEGLASYIAEDDPDAAGRTILQIIEAVNRLREYPAMGRPGRVHGTRELVVAGTPFIVPYRVRGNTVQVLRVMHAARRWLEPY